MSQFTNFPNGFLAGITVRGLPILQSQPGNVYWVDNSPAKGGQGTNSQRFTGGSDNNPGTFQKPLATIAQAFALCTNGNGDIIMVKPGHCEYINAAFSLTTPGSPPVYDPTGATVVSTGGSSGYNLTFNTSDVAVIGLGSGNARPTIVWETATTATLQVSAAGCSIQNFRFIAAFAAIATAFKLVGGSTTTSTVTAAASGLPTYFNAAGTTTGTVYSGAALAGGTTTVPGTQIVQALPGVAATAWQISPNQAAVASFTAITGPQDFDIENCDFIDAGTALNFLAGVTTDATANAADGLRVVGCNHYSIASSGAISLIKLGAAIARITATDNFSVSAAAITGGAIIAGGANNMTLANIGRNKVYRPTVTASTAIVVSSSSTACTGLMYDNYGWCLGATTLLISTGTVLGFANNFCSITGTADKQATQNPLLT